MTKTNQSIEKAVALLRHLAEHPDDTTVGALARGTQIPRPTASRLLRTLEQTGLLDRDPVSDRYALGHLASRLGHAADPRQTLIFRGRSILRSLADSSGETAYLTFVTDNTLHVVAAEATTNIVAATMPRWLGEQRFPLHATSNGKLLLAELPYEVARDLVPTLVPCTPRTIISWEHLAAELAKIREVGYAATKDELEEGLSTVSAPVRDGQELTAIVTLTGPTFRFGDDAVQRAALELCGGAAALEKLLA